MIANAQKHAVQRWIMLGMHYTSWTIDEAQGYRGNRKTWQDYTNLSKLTRVCVLTYKN